MINEEIKIWSKNIKTIIDEDLFTMNAIFENYINGYCSYECTSCNKKNKCDEKLLEKVYDIYYNKVKNNYDFDEVHPPHLSDECIEAKIINEVKRKIEIDYSIDSQEFYDIVECPLKRSEVYKEGESMYLTHSVMYGNFIYFVLILEHKLEVGNTIKKYL